MSMTSNEAYDQAMAFVNELGAMGIDVDTKVPQLRTDPDTIAKYSGPERVAPDKWLSVTFHPLTDEHRQAIADRAKKLAWMGICFDVGGGAGLRNWELDWSFHVVSFADGEHEHRMGVVEGIIRDTIEGGETAGPPA
jgi:hypothetical protein